MRMTPSALRRDGSERQQARVVGYGSWIWRTVGSPWRRTESKTRAPGASHILRHTSAMDRLRTECPSTASIWSVSRNPAFAAGLPGASEETMGSWFLPNTVANPDASNPKPR